MPSAKTSLLKLVYLLAPCLLLAPNNLAHAQDKFFLPVEFGQGIIFQPGVDPYIFSAQAHPSLGFGANSNSLLIGASLAAVYDNPAWAFMWGGRLVLSVSNLKKKPINRGPQVTYGTLHLTGTVLMENAELRRVAGGIIIDVWEGALLIGPRVGYDRKRERTFLEVGLGRGF